MNTLCLPGCWILLVFLGTGVEAQNTSSSNTSAVPADSPEPAAGTVEARVGKNPIWTLGVIDAVGGSGAIGSEVPELHGIDITCTDPGTTKYSNGNKCDDGTEPKTPSKSQNESFSSAWYHPSNEESIKHVVKTVEMCSPSCESECYYSMTYFEFLCGLENQKDYVKSKAEFKEIERFHNISRKFGEGRICSEGRRRGMLWDSNLITHEDVVAAAWYMDPEVRTDLERSEVEKDLSHNCKENDCEFVQNRAAFICGGTGRGQKLQPFGLLAIVSIGVSVFVFHIRP